MFIDSDIFPVVLFLNLFISSNSTSPLSSKKAFWYLLTKSELILTLGFIAIYLKRVNGALMLNLFLNIASV